MNAYKRPFAFLACALAASVSSAATVDVTFDDNIFNGSGYDNVFIELEHPDSEQAVMKKEVSAGRFQGTATKLVGVSESIFVDGVDDLFLYCFDIYQGIWGGKTVPYTIKFDGVSERTLDFLGAVNKEMNGKKTGKDYDPYAWLHPINGFQGAAIQLGIWESKYESDKDWSLVDGSFEASKLRGSTKHWWKKFTEAIDDSASLEGKYVMVLENDDFQDMIVGDPPAEVPEPGSLALLGLGLTGLAFARRKKLKLVS